MSMLRSFSAATALAALLFSSTAARADDDAEPSSPTYRAGDPVPPGYHLQKFGAGPVIAVTGEIALGISWGGMIAIGLLGGLVCGIYRCDHPSMLLWTTVPVAGPLRLAGGGDSGDGGNGLLHGIAAVQAASIGVIAIGGLVYLATPDSLAPNATGHLSMHVAPLLGGGTSGLAVGGTF